MPVDLVAAHAQRDQHHQRDERGQHRGQRPAHAAPRPAARPSPGVLPFSEPRDKPLSIWLVIPLGRLACVVLPRSPPDRARPGFVKAGSAVVLAPPTPGGPAGFRTRIPVAGARLGRLVIYAAAVAGNGGWCLWPAGIRRWPPPERARILRPPHGCRAG